MGKRGKPVNQDRINARVARLVAAGVKIERARPDDPGPQRLRPGYPIADIRDVWRWRCELCGRAGWPISGVWGLLAQAEQHTRARLHRRAVAAAERREAPESLTGLETADLA